jgi:hypothetical protein
VRQNEPKLGELARLRIDLNKFTRLLNDDVVSNRQTKPSPFSGGLRREEWIEHFVFYLEPNAGAVCRMGDGISAATARVRISAQ